VRSSRRKVLKDVAALGVMGSSIIPVVGVAAPDGSRTITSVSWIDAEGLPSAGILEAAMTLGAWPFRVAVGLKGTSNPRPPKKIPENFKDSKQFRALTQYKIDKSDKVSLKIIDPGYTPPFDILKVPNIAGAIAWSSDDGKAHAGEKSSISSVEIGKLHPFSTLSLPAGSVVLASALIKFRAGSYTNDIGIEKAGSPFHVPWVWCEHALVRNNGKLLMVANGSSFPSHAWYVDGNIVGMLLQKKVTLSENAPALSAGAIVSKSLPSKLEDGVTGQVDQHPHTIGKIRSDPIILNV